MVDKAPDRLDLSRQMGGRKSETWLQRNPDEVSLCSAQIQPQVYRHNSPEVVSEHRRTESPTG